MAIMNSEDPMNKRNPFVQRWRALGITKKFTLANGALLALIILVALTGYAALIVVQSQTEAAILTAMEVRRLVLKMDAGLQSARRFERDFFLRWPTVGFAEAEQTYAQSNSDQIAEVVKLSAELQQLISQPNVSEALREANVNLNFYLSAANRYAVAFDEAVMLVANLAADETGAQARLAQNSALLLEALQQANDPRLIVLYRELQAFEKDYLVTRQRPFMQRAFNVAGPLREAIIDSAGFEEDSQRDQALTYLADYRTVAEEVLQLDVDIRSKFSEFDLQAKAVDPISAELIQLANDEVQQARDRIAQTSRLATMLLVVAVATAVGLTGLIAWAQHRAITANIVKLTETVVELQNGNLAARAQIDSADEIGQLAGGFNAMAEQLDALIGNLEQNVEERTQELSQALENLQATQTHLVETEKMAALGGLVAGVAHEINTPVGVGVTAASLLEDKTIAFQETYQSGQMKRSDLEKYLDTAGQSSKMILKNLNRAAELIQSFKQVAVDQSSEERREFLIKEYLEEILLSLRPQLKKTQHAININGDDTLMLDSYPGVFSQIVTNLVMNSLLHAYDQNEAGQLTFEFSQNNGRLNFEYSDDGKGISKENLDKIFDPFFTTKRGQGGSGLGLHIIYNLVTQKLDGTIRCESETGVGTRFVIELLPNGEQ